MQTIALADSDTGVAASAKSLALHGAQRPFVASANEDLNEALWEAYQRSDKTAVTEELLRRYLHQWRDNRQHIGGERDG
jgi:hypothetical protein